MQKIAGFVTVSALSLAALSGVALAVTDTAAAAVHPRSAHVRADGDPGTVPTPLPVPVNPTDPTGPITPDTWGWG